MKGVNSVRHNIIANFAGGAWTSLIILAFVPFLIKLVGVEAYGLIGIFTSLTALLAVLDMGLSSTLNRELSRLSAMERSDQEARDLVRTLEAVYWGVGILIGIGVVFLAPFIARRWVNPQSVSVETVESTVMMMGFSLAFQWPSSLYAGGLMGLQRQVLLNVVKMVLGTVQYGGAVLVLWFISPTILAFFTWQLLISAANTFVLKVSLRQTLPGGGLRAHFSRRLLRKNWHFAAGMMGISALVTILTQLDKIILSKMLTLEFFGYYILAFSVANILNQLVSPISTALFPKFSQVVAMGDEKHLASLYHKGCQLIAVLVLPAAFTLMLFSKQIVFLWLGNPVIVQKTYLILALLAGGTALNALMTLPYALQLANGWTRLSFLKNVIAVMLLVPLMIGLTRHCGAAGAALVWIILNFGYFLIEIPVMHRRLLKREMVRWYVYDVVAPLAVIVIIEVFARFLMPGSESRLFVFSWVSVTFMLALAASAMIVNSISMRMVGEEAL